MDEQASIKPYSESNYGPLTRRALDKAILLAFFATAGAAWIDQIRKILPPPEKTKPNLPEPFSLHNMEVQLYPVDHFQEDWAQNAEQLSWQIENSDLIIPEYLPYEFTGPNSNIATQVATAAYGNQNVLFDRVQEKITQNRKPVTMVEPAHSADFVAIRASLSLVDVPVNLPTDLYVVSRLASQIKSKTRRDFFKAMGYTGATFLALATSVSPVSDLDLIPAYVFDQPPTDPALMLERDLRRAQNAHNLEIASRTVKPGTKTLIIYPPPHLYGELGTYGIIDYLAHPNTRENRLAKYYEVLGHVPAIQNIIAKMSEIRHYSAISGAIQPVSSENK